MVEKIRRTRPSANEDVKRMLAYESPKRTKHTKVRSFSYKKLPKKLLIKNQISWIYKNSKPVFKELSDFEKFEYWFIRGNTDRVDLFESPSEKIRKNNNDAWAQSKIYKVTLSKIEKRKEFKIKQQEKKKKEYEEKEKERQEKMSARSKSSQKAATPNSRNCKVFGRYYNLSTS